MLLAQLRCEALGGVTVGEVDDMSGDLQRRVRAANSRDDGSETVGVRSRRTRLLPRAASA
jgi:hypothetical protein